MGSELKPEMWEKTTHFIEQIGCEDVEDVSWSYEDNAVKKITITLEHPIFLTGEPPERNDEEGKCLRTD